MGVKRIARAQLSLPERSEMDFLQLLPLLSQQEEGCMHYGEAIYPPEKRTRVSTPLAALQYAIAYHKADQVRDVCAPDPHLFRPATVGEPNGSEAKESTQDANDDGCEPLMGQQGYLQDEELLLMEAREAGKSWTDISAMLPRRTVTALKRHYNTFLRPKVSSAERAPKTEEPAAARQPSPAPRSLGKPPRPASARQGTPTSSRLPPSKSSLSEGHGLTSPLSASSRRSSPGAAESAAEKAAEQLGVGERVEVDARCTGRSGGDARVRLSRPLLAAPSGATVLIAHPKLSSLRGKDARQAGVRFFAAVDVSDPDEPGRLYSFDLSNREHGPCFNIGQGADSTPLISWSNLYSLYELPDGSKWAEHGFFHDTEDMEEMAKKKVRKWNPPRGSADSKQELYRKAGRYHSRLQNVEYECWVFQGALPTDEKLSEMGLNKADSYFWRTSFDPETLDIC